MGKSMSHIDIVGIGGGKYEGMTMEALESLKKADVIVGYTKYIELIKPSFPDKEIYATGMKQEVDRCKAALDMALEGKRIAVVCSGDAGVYGMAGLVLQLSGEEDRYKNICIEVVPGVTAALSGAALLGAPLGHDFAVISLSDLLTPWEVIEKRVRACSAADMCMAIYNPSSRSRSDYLMKICDIMLESKGSDTVCGIACNIGREGESVEVMTLRELRDTSVDMFSTVFIGNSNTSVINGRMVTPRGYKI